MTFAQKDRSTQDGQPVEFIEFTGPFGTFRYTTNDVPSTCDGEIYLPLPGGVRRTSIETSSIIDTIMTMDFMMPAKSDLARLYCYKRSPETLTVIVRKAHRGDDWNSEFEIEWFGFGMNASVKGHTATISTGSVIQAQLNGNLGSVYYQRLCNHVLFDDRCKVDPGDWTTEATVVKIQSQLITVDNDGLANGELRIGQIVNTRNGERRGVYDNVNNIISVSYGFVDIEVGDTVELILGCDHKRLSHCKQRFDNVVNYGGFDFIPTRNPFEDLTLNAKVTESTKKKQWYDEIKVSGG